MSNGRINLNSLTDLVSNTVGILVLLSLISVVQGREKQFAVEVPAEEPSSQRPVFFVCQDNRIVHLDLTVLMLQAATVAGDQDLPAGYSKPVDLEYHGFSILSPNQEMKLFLSDTSSWTEMSEIGPGSDIHEVFNNIDPKTEYAYFFVYNEPVSYSTLGSGVPVFQSVRKMLAERNVRSGWRPLQGDDPVEICEWWWREPCYYAPSYH